MKRFLRKGLSTYEIESGFSLQAWESGLTFRDLEAAQAFLTEFMGDYSNMNTLRTLVGEATSLTLCRMNDHEVIRQAARLISGKRICVGEPIRVKVEAGLTIAPGYADETPVSRIKPSEPPRPDIQPPAAPPEIPNLGVQVEAFKQAAATGTPFCEVCAEL